MQRLLDVRTADGSRYFGELPERRDAAEPHWQRLREHVEALAGAQLLPLGADVHGAGLVFSLSGHEFSLRHQHGKWRALVKDVACPDELLIQVLDHLERELDPDAALARGFGPITAGGYRVVVFDEQQRFSFADFASHEAADRYADDCASEAMLTLADVFDDQFRHVGRGEHYALRGMAERERAR